MGASALTGPAKGTLGFAEASTAGDEQSRTHARVMDALKATFRPEFLNRIDDIIVFNRLTEENIRAIASLMLAEVAERVENLGISITFDDAVIAKLAKEGFDAVYGARPLRRAIVRLVEDAFSGEMLEGKLQKGDSVRATVREDAIVFEKDAERTPAADVQSTDAE